MPLTYVASANAPPLPGDPLRFFLDRPMPSTAIIGLQWGDEGKGKIIDGLAAEADVVARYAGGNNAGHTVVVGEDKWVLHLVPGGILHEGTRNLIGRGLVVDLAALADEVDGLVDRGVPVPERLLLDARAQVIFPFHRQLDGLSERWRGDGRIGTTGRGIGPAYADKVSRTGLRVADLLDPHQFETRLHAAIAEKKALLKDVYGDSMDEEETILPRARELAERFRPLVVDGGELLRQAHQEGKRILFEGAQGSLLDLDAGTYPFVTSSWTGTWGIAGGTGFPARHLDRAYAVTKAYTTRVGEGPFPTELHGETGERLREAGNEYGATTGRPRRCGWFDILAARYAAELNGLDGVVVTNLDVLSGFHPLSVAVGYRLGNQTFDRYPAHLPVLDSMEPIYRQLDGWDEDITGCRSLDDLPQAAREYFQFLAEGLGVPVVQVSVGPERSQLLNGQAVPCSYWSE